MSVMKTAIVMLIPVLPALPYALQPAPELPLRAPTPAPVESSRSSPTTPADASRRAPTPFTEREIRERSEHWTPLDLEVPGWRLLMTDYFAVRSDAPIEDVRAAGVYLEEFLKSLHRQVGGDYSEFRFSVRLYRREREFRIYAQCRGVPNAESFYDPSGAEIAVYLTQPPDRERLCRLLMHEFAHQYVHRIFERSGPMWLAEGLAEYFSNYTFAKGTVLFGGDFPAHRARILRAKRLKSFIPLRRLVRMDRETFYDGDPMLAYAESWALVRYLAERPEALKALVRGASLADLVPEATAEAEWLAKFEE